MRKERKIKMGNFIGCFDGSSTAAVTLPVDISASSSSASGISGGNYSSSGPRRRYSESSSSGNSGVSFGDQVMSLKESLPPSGEISVKPSLRAFSFTELKNATKNFRPELLLGEGGFGKVYKGWIHEEDKNSYGSSKSGSKFAVAIKKLNSQSLQGLQEWQSEVNFLGRLSHPNLVKLLGYCWEDKELLLVYEYLPKGSLENHLFRRMSSIEPLSWEKRMSIALGVAKGLAFLHSSDEHVIYRDFKAANVLLDVNYEAKISDFGLAKLGPSGEKSHVSTRVMGTNGYAAPEYVATGHLYLKSDVYGFGVVMLEMLTGLRAVDFSREKRQQNLVAWAKSHLSNKRKLTSIMDRRLEGQYSLKAAFELAQLTLKCLEPDPRVRPSMKRAVTVLEKIEAIIKSNSNYYSARTNKGRSSGNSTTGSKKPVYKSSLYNPQRNVLPKEEGVV